MEEPKDNKKADQTKLEKSGLGKLRALERMIRERREEERIKEEKKKLNESIF